MFEIVSQLFLIPFKISLLHIGFHWLIVAILSILIIFLSASELDNIGSYILFCGIYYYYYIGIYYFLCDAAAISLLQISKLSMLSIISCWIMHL